MKSALAKVGLTFLCDLYINEYYAGVGKWRVFTKEGISFVGETESEVIRRIEEWGNAL